MFSRQLGSPKGDSRLCVCVAFIKSNNENICVFKDTKVSYMHTLSHLSSHSVALHDPKNRRCPSIDISWQFPWLPLWRAGYASKLRSVFGPALELRLLSIKRGGASLVGSFRNVPAGGWKGGVVGYNGFREKVTHPTKTDDFKVFYSKGGYQKSRMCLDERGVSNMKLCALVCCCDLQGHSNGKGMSLVLASLSSAFYTSISKICDTKIMWVVSKGPFGLFLVVERCYCKEPSKSEWLFYSLL